MQQVKNSGTEYISLGLAANQRGQNGKDESVFYQCYCNKFFADHLLKAGVKNQCVSWSTAIWNSIHTSIRKAIMQVGQLSRRKLW
nr:hypothetical protein [Mediterraneibacter glycyrrhizinilyticus]